MDLQLWLRCCVDRDEAATRHLQGMSTPLEEVHMKAADISDDEEAMKAIRLLRSKGYTSANVRNYMRLLEYEDFEFKCTRGHDRCGKMYAGPECPYCERRGR